MHEDCECDGRCGKDQRSAADEGHGDRFSEGFGKDPYVANNHADDGRNTTGSRYGCEPPLRHLRDAGGDQLKRPRRIGAPRALEVLVRKGVLVLQEPAPLEDLLQVQLLRTGSCRWLSPFECIDAVRHGIPHCRGLQRIVASCLQRSSLTKECV